MVLQRQSEVSVAIVDYSQYLEAERHLFAWCLMRIGGFSASDANAEALIRYPWESPEDEYRELVFHRTAWTWAIIRIFGDEYREGPDFDPAIRTAYQVESERVHT